MSSTIAIKPAKNKKKANRPKTFSRFSTSFDFFELNEPLQRVFINSKSATQLIEKTPKEILLGDLAAIFNECKHDNWDDMGAKAINQQSFEHIKLLISNLPEKLKLPEPAPEPTGYMGLQWINKDNLLALSIDDKGVLVYSYLNPHVGQRSATLRFNGQIPPELHMYIQEMQ